MFPNNLLKKKRQFAFHEQMEVFNASGQRVRVFYGRKLTNTRTHQHLLKP